MKGIKQFALHASRPEMDIADALGYCLSRLYADHAHTTDEEVVYGLTYEELIGALVHAQDFIHEMRETEDDETYRDAGSGAGITQF